MLRTRLRGFSDAYGSSSRTRQERRALRSERMGALLILDSAAARYLRYEPRQRKPRRAGDGPRECRTNHRHCHPAGMARVLSPQSLRVAHVRLKSCGFDSRRLRFRLKCGASCWGFKVLYNAEGWLDSNGRHVKDDRLAGGDRTAAHEKWPIRLQIQRAHRAHTRARLAQRST